ncbi:MAG: hypothetical protein ACN6OP_26685 [Pseudomonadales bacterium]
MYFITTGVIASAAYDVFKQGLRLSAQSLKDRLGRWIKDEVIGEALAKEMNALGVNDQLSETALTRLLDSSSAVGALVKSINAQIAVVAPSAVSGLSQVHSGIGDNVGGNKIVN